MNQTIYFRKDVWKDFEKEQDKSKLINELLSTHYNARTGVSTHVSIKDGVILYGGKINAQNPVKTVDFCKHGSDPSFCKFTKPGKKCK